MGAASASWSKLENVNLRSFFETTKNPNHPQPNYFQQGKRNLAEGGTPSWDEAPVIAFERVPQTGKVFCRHTPGNGGAFG
jgi:hypothetical protein